MREGRVIALAGLFQALALVRAIALRGGCDAQAMRNSLASVLRIDAESPTDVFGGIGNLRLGLETLISQLDGQGERDAHVTRMGLAVLRLQGSLAARGEILKKLREEIEGIAKLSAQADAAHVDIPARLAGLYADTLSRIKPRVMIEGNHVFLNQTTQQNQIRALLLAAVRAAVLWRQLDGSQLSLLFRRREYAMLARGLLARCTLDGT
jgi:high frequency lysogenization protein